MPTYVFKCGKCEGYAEVKFTLDEIKDKEPEANCSSCEVPMERDYRAEFATHNYAVERDKLKPKNIGAHADTIRREQAAKIEMAISEEGFESSSEIKESQDMAKEEEKKRGLTPGSLTTGVKMPSTKEGMEVVKKRCQAKKKESADRRRKVV